ncbi:MAG TPA: hypothetical protein VLF59_05890 [Candidatus Saccharimonadales bacterium]|nr:hypothetical protein [Candidatus Saccharimonadales bacterium]
MENFPGASHESESNKDGTDKNGVRRRLRMQGIARLAAENNKKEEQTEPPKQLEATRTFNLVKPPATDEKRDRADKQAENHEPELAITPDLQSVAGETGRTVGEHRASEDSDDWSARNAREAYVPEAEPEALAENTVIASQEDYEQWGERELAPNELYGGEVIDLAGAGVERVIDLRAPAEASPPVADMQPEVTPVPEAARQNPDVPEAPAWLPAHHQATQPSHESAVPRPPVAPEQPEYAAMAVPFVERPQAEPYPQAHESYPATQGSQEYASMVTPASERTVRTASGKEQPVTKRDMEDAVYTATRAGVGRGLVTGLLVGGAYEHLKHKRREKKQNKKMERQNKRLEQARSQYQFATAQQHLREAATEHQMNAAERRYQRSQFESREQLEQQARHHDARLASLQAAGSEQTRPAAGTVSPERQWSAANGMPERPTGPNAGQFPMPPQVREQAASLSPEDRLQVPEGHRIDASGAFIAELDKTGKLVEVPSFAYGQEFYRERAQEAGPVAQRNVAAGEIALVAASLSESGKGGSHEDLGQRVTSRPADAGVASSTVAQPGTMPLNIPSATTKGAPLVIPPSASGVSAKESSKDMQAQKPLWPLVVTLVAIVVVIFFLAR